MRVCFAASEAVPFVKTGGLADVSGALPHALAQRRCQVKVFLPLYGSISTADHGLELLRGLQNIPVQIGDQGITFNTWYKKDGHSGVEFYFIDCPHYFHRDSLYTGDPDEHERFILLQDGIIAVLQRLAWAPDIVHANDWQTGLLPVFIKEKYAWDRLFANTATVFSIHNIAYQGNFPGSAIAAAGLPMHYSYPTGPLEFYGQLSFLKAGIAFADVINTVSETYAREIQTPEYGAGMEGILATRKADLYGILNGIDTETWNPRKDPLIPYHYDLRSQRNKVRVKQALLKQVHLPFAEEVPVIGMVLRLVQQKGIDLVQQAFAELMRLPLQIVLLGSGEATYEAFFRQVSVTYAQKVSAYIGYNDELAHWVTAGSDMYLMPSRFEPCGLNQMYSLRYGTVPIVRQTGGLADTVRDVEAHPDTGNGFVFSEYSTAAMLAAIRRALALFEQDKPRWKQLMKRGMKADFSWNASARRYLELYKTARGKRQS